ncbi:MAG: Type III restriction-modification system methylation subunit, partial [uncultured Rubrobacteraceae bacterium]
DAGVRQAEGPPRRALPVRPRGPGLRHLPHHEPEAGRGLEVSGRGLAAAGSGGFQGVPGRGRRGRAPGSRESGEDPRGGGGHGRVFAQVRRFEERARGTFLRPRLRQRGQHAGPQDGGRRPEGPPHRGRVPAPHVRVGGRV